MADRELELRILVEARERDLAEADAWGRNATSAGSMGAAIGASTIAAQIETWEQEYVELTGAPMVKRWKQ